MRLRRDGQLAKRRKKSTSQQLGDFEYKSNSNIRIELDDNSELDEYLMRKTRAKQRENAGRQAKKASADAARGVMSAVKHVLSEPIVIVAAVLLMFILLFLRPYLVPSGSMHPTLLEGDRVISIARYFPNGHTYNRGDVVCFTAPDGSVYVKRVVGVGGDHVQISGEKVFVNGEESPWQGTGGLMTSMDIHLADDEYWVMGDNRGNSQDSRFIGAIRADKMISKVYCIYFPFSRATFL